MQFRAHIWKKRLTAKLLFAECITCLLCLLCFGSRIFDLYFILYVNYKFWISGPLIIIIFNSFLNGLKQKFLTTMFSQLYPEWPVASHAAIARSIPAEIALIYTMHKAPWGTAHQGGGCDQSIWFTVFDAIIHSWLWLTATSSSKVGCFSTLLQVVDSWPHILW